MRRDFLYSGIIIDIPWRTLLMQGPLALAQPIAAGARLRERLQRLIGSASPDGVTTLSAVSVRSLLDLYLRVQAFPAGSEVIVSAINIPAMAEIIEAHGLLPITWDIDQETLAPRFELLARLVTSKTRAIMVSALFGKAHDLTAVAAFARQHGLVLIEDYAEALFDKDDLAVVAGDIKLFSLGLIKHYTALGGGFALLRSPAEQEAMRALQASYPRQSWREALQRFIKGFLLCLVLNTRPVVAVMLWLARSKRFGSIDTRLEALLRAYPSRLLERIRQQPSAALLWMMIVTVRRILTSHGSEVKAKGDLLAERLKGNFVLPGQAAYRNNYWLFPVISRNRQQLAQVLRVQGVHCFVKGSLTVIGNEQLCAPANVARTLLERALFLPFNRHLPEYEIERLAERVLAAERTIASHHFTVGQLEEGGALSESTAVITSH